MCACACVCVCDGEGKARQTWIRKCNQGGLIMDGRLFTSVSSLPSCTHALLSTERERGRGQAVNSQEHQRLRGESGSDGTIWKAGLFTCWHRLGVKDFPRLDKNNRPLSMEDDSHVLFSKFRFNHRKTKQTLDLGHTNLHWKKGEDKLHSMNLHPPHVRKRIIREFHVGHSVFGLF